MSTPPTPQLGHGSSAPAEIKLDALNLSKHRHQDFNFPGFSKILNIIISRTFQMHENQREILRDFPAGVGSPH